MCIRWLALLIAFAMPAASASAQTLKLLTAGAFKEVALAVVPGFEARSGLKVEIVSDTAGGLARRVEGGEPFDVVVLTHEGVRRLAAQGAVAAASLRDLARVGIGVGVREGAPLPPLSTVEEFKATLRAARAVAYIDPAAGGSSGIYLTALFERLGIADVIRPKAVLVPGGLAAERVAQGEADLVLQQASEVLPIKGVVLAGLLPEAIQNFTIYAAGLPARGTPSTGAQALLGALASAPPEVLRAKGMLQVAP